MLAFLDCCSLDLENVSTPKFPFLYDCNSTAILVVSACSSAILLNVEALPGDLYMSFSARWAAREVFVGTEFIGYILCCKKGIVFNLFVC